MNKETVFVGLSGGVDSSVAAKLLLDQGYDVVGVFIKVWQPDFLNCNWEQERLDAMRVAAHLDIPFLTCDAQERYKTEVGEYFVRAYEAGLTPNPDVMCNQHVKFGAFLDFAEQHGVHKVATGHYAQVDHINTPPRLLRGVDTEKDQSYFLWTLTESQLSRTLLPVGNQTKQTTRKIADAAGIPTATKKDSQGICFLGHVDIPSFLSHFMTLERGVVRDTSGGVIGEHKGAVAYTIGQRHGFVISNQTDVRTPHYVVEKNIDTNELIVDDTQPELSKSDHLSLTDLNLYDTYQNNDRFDCEAQFRYRQKPFATTVIKEPKGYRLKVNQSVEKPAIGQSCVLYNGEQCIGGGMIAT